MRLAKAITVRRAHLEDYYAAFVPFREFMPLPVVFRYRVALREIEAAIEHALEPRRSPKLGHLCSDRVAHPRHRTLARKPQMGKVLLSPAPLGRWITLREHTRVISRECRSARRPSGARGQFSFVFFDATRTQMRDDCLP